LYYLYSSDKNIDNKKEQAYPEFNLYDGVQAKKNGNIRIRKE